MIFKSHTDLTDLTDLFFRCKQRFSPCLTVKTPKELKIREIREIRVGKIQHSTFNIQHYKKWIYEVTPSRS